MSAEKLKLLLESGVGNPEDALREYLEPDEREADTHIELHGARFLAAIEPVGAAFKFEFCRHEEIYIPRARIAEFKHQIRSNTIGNCSKVEYPVIKVTMDYSTRESGGYEKIRTLSLILWGGKREELKKEVLHMLCSCTRERLDLVERQKRLEMYDFP